MKGISKRILIKTLKVMGLSLLSLGIFFCIILLGYAAYLENRKVCVEWEPDPVTGSICVETESHTTMCTSVNSDGNLSTHLCTETECVKYQACRRCRAKIDKDEAPAEIDRPVDRCPGR